MISKIETRDDIAIVSLGKIYGNDTISDIMKFAKSEVLKGARYVIIDCTKLEAIDSMGTELFIVRDHFIGTRGQYFFLSGLDEVGNETINGFGSASGHITIRNFPTLDEAIRFIESTK